MVHSTEDAVRWNSGKISEFEILIPRVKFHDSEKMDIILMGDEGKPRKEFEIGDSLLITAKGLIPMQSYSIRLQVAEKELFTSRFITNTKGELESTVLWPQMGLDDPNSGARYTIDEAHRKWKGKTITLGLILDEKTIFKQEITIAEVFTQPIVLCTDRDGRMLNGFEVGSKSLYITFKNLPFSGKTRIYMIPRQYDWQEGDPFKPVILANNRLAVQIVELPNQGSQTVVKFASAEALLPGAYDLIVRPVRYGYENDDELQILATDIVSHRFSTSIVIRENFLSGKPVLGGCVNRIPISGQSIAGTPYFRYRDTFEIGEDVYAAIDPGIVDPGNHSKMCALYIIPSKDNIQWNDNSLNHLPVLGGNSAVPKIKVQTGCVNSNRVLIWPNANQLGEYDIVADFGNNTEDASNFVPDNAYDTPLDMIDGYFLPGFRIVEDPGTLNEFQYAGNWNYDATDLAYLGFPAYWIFQDENTSYSTPGGFSTVDTVVSLKGHVYFPAEEAGVTDPDQIHLAQPDYPLIVVVHGNGHNYESYDWLLEYFAKNGFIAASIHLESNMRALGRANVLFYHLRILQSKFGSNLQTNIGLMGHSRGGEAIVKAARLNQEQTLAHNINALISLAPTDQYGKEELSGDWVMPYLVIYGSRDGDIDGGIWTSGYTVPQTGFALYDRVNDGKKSMVFVYRATHNGFITSNYDADYGDTSDLLLPESQQKVTKAYMNAFFRQHLKGESKWDGIFTGLWKPASVAQTGLELYVQSQNPEHKTVDDFESAVADWESSTIGGGVAHNGTLPDDPEEGKMHDHPSAPGLDSKSPHDTKGMLLHWDNIGDKLVLEIPPADNNISIYSNLSFRVAQKVDSDDNLIGLTQDFRVELKDSSGNERAIRVSAFNDIPFPDHRSVHSNTKSAMNTIRIPLTSYTIVCAGQPKVDLQNIVSLSFIFSQKVKGEIALDSIEFTI